MDAQRPSRSGYSYSKAAWPHRKEDGKADAGALAAPRRSHMLKLAVRVRPFYEQAGQPFGAGDAGLLLWLDFGRRSHAN